MNLATVLDFAQVLQQVVQHDTGATVFAYYVSDPERYGVVIFCSFNCYDTNIYS